MATSNSKGKRGQGFLVTRPGAVDHMGIDERLLMNKWQFLYVIQKMKIKPKAPRLEQVAVPFSFFIALLLAMLPSDFKDYLGIDAKVWQATALGFTILSGIVTVVLFVLWLTNSIRHKEQTPEDILNEIICGMESEQKKLQSKLDSNEVNK